MAACFAKISACEVADYFYSLLCIFTCIRATEATIYFSCILGEMLCNHKRHQTDPFSPLDSKQHSCTCSCYQTPVVPLAVCEMQHLSPSFQCPHLLPSSSIYYASLTGNCPVLLTSCVHDLALTIKF